MADSVEEVIHMESFLEGMRASGCPPAVTASLEELHVWVGQLGARLAAGSAAAEVESVALASADKAPGSEESGRLAEEAAQARLLAAARARQAGALQARVEGLEAELAGTRKAAAAAQAAVGDATCAAQDARQRADAEAASASAARAECSTLQQVCFRLTPDGPHPHPHRSPRLPNSNSGTWLT